MGKSLIALSLLAACAGCSSLPPNTAAVTPQVEAACKKDPKGCAVLPITRVEDALEEAFNMGRFIGAMER